MVSMPAPRITTSEPNIIPVLVLVNEIVITPLDAVVLTVAGPLTTENDFVESKLSEHVPPPPTDNSIDGPKLGDSGMNM